MCGVCVCCVGPSDEWDGRLRVGRLFGVLHRLFEWREKRVAFHEGRQLSQRATAEESVDDAGNSIGG